jgi:hypothetical protein
MGRDTVADASKALRLLNHPDMRQHPATGPTQRRAHPTTPGAPLNLGIVDRITKAVDEVVDFTITVTAQPTPLPSRVEDVYDWCIENTANADDTQRRYRDTLIETHRLEHAVALGEYDEVCKHPCPRCGCWGLEWDHGGNRALCLNRRCRTPGGMSSTWTLARLAAQKIWRTEIWRRNAT